MSVMVNEFSLERLRRLIDAQMVDKSLWDAPTSCLEERLQINLKKAHSMIFAEVLGRIDDEDSVSWGKL